MNRALNRRGFGLFRGALPPTVAVVGPPGTRRREARLARVRTGELGPSDKSPSIALDTVNQLPEGGTDRMPNMMEHARGIAEQIAASKDKVRSLTDHWGTDGAHREQVLREMIVERVPPRCRVERGFIVTGSSQSGQIDTLIVDAAKPVVSRSPEGSVFVTPDSVLAIIEVKSKPEGPKAYKEALRQLANNASLCGDQPIWTGLFCFEAGSRADFWDGPDDRLLDAANATKRETGVRVSSVCVGPDVFLRYWENSALQAGGICEGPAWHSYFMIQLAPAYFIGNLVAHLSHVPDEYADVWFPIPDGKETMRRWYAELGGRPNLFPGYRKSSEVNGIQGVLKRAAEWSDGAI